MIVYFHSRYLPMRRTDGSLNILLFIQTGKSFLATNWPHLQFSFLSFLAYRPSSIPINYVGLIFQRNRPSTCNNSMENDSKMVFFFICIRIFFQSELRFCLYNIIILRALYYPVLRG